MKIAMVIDAWFPHYGGGQVHVWEISKHLADLGHQITIYTRNLGEWKEVYPNIEVIRQGSFEKFSNTLGRIWFLLAALTHLLFYKYDIIHLHAFSPGLLAPFIKFFKKTPIVFTVHGKGVKIAGLGIGAKWLHDYVLYNSSYDVEITVAERTLEKRSNAKKIAVIPNGVDLEKFKSAHRKRDKIELIAYLGRLSYEKGVDLLVEAFKSINDKDLKLLIIGNGSEENKLKQLSKNFPIIFQNSISSDEVVKSYRQVDLVVLPSRTEGLPLTLFESWAAKVPVLATDVGDNSRYIQNEVNGFLIDPDVESLKKQLMKIKSHKRISGIVENAYKDVQSYSWKNIAKQTLALYKQVVFSS